jgi:hypothetical protein
MFTVISCISVHRRDLLEDTFNFSFKSESRSRHFEQFNMGTLTYSYTRKYKYNNMTKLIIVILNIVITYN